MSEPTYTSEFYLAAGDATAQGRMPLGLVFDRCIEVATDHANALGVGYDDMILHGQSWVLSRVAIEMRRYPEINERYSVTTWVEKVSRAFSMRNFAIRAENGETIGYGRSTWVAIDVEKRTLGDISRYTQLEEISRELPCPIEPVGRHRAVAEPTLESDYRFQYSDIDSNRHVNTVRYVELLLNSWPLEFFDRHEVSRVEVSFMKESYFGEEARVVLAAGEGETEADIVVDGSARVHFTLRFRDI